MPTPRKPGDPRTPRMMSDVRRRPRPAPAMPVGRSVTLPPKPAVQPKPAARPSSRFARPRPVRQLPAISGRLIKIVIAAILIIGVFNLLTAKRTVTRTANVPAAAKVTKPQSICLDPGHGGADPGATAGRFTERDINLTVALGVRTILEAQGYRVFMTRTTNGPNLANRDRYNFCNAKKATILVSVHHNFFEDASVNHDTALYFKPTDQSLAASLVNATAAKLALDNNGIAQFESGVLSKSIMPAALSEAFFITNTGELAKLKTSGSTRLTDEAQGLADGIMSYFTAPAASPPPTGTAPNIINRND